MIGVNALCGGGAFNNTGAGGVIDYHMQLIVAGGASGRIVTSPDGVNWTVQTSPFGVSFWEGSAYSPELDIFVASGDAGKIAYSSNGTTWTLGTGAGTGHKQDVAWSPELGIFVAVTATSSGARYRSADGINWTLSGTGGNALYSITWSSALGIFLAAGQGGRVVTSPDGINWTDQTTNGITQTTVVEYSEYHGVFIASGTGTQFKYNATGTGAWTLSAGVTTNSPASALNVRDTDGEIVVGSYRGSYKTTAPNAVYYAVSGNFGVTNFTEIVYVPWAELYVATKGLSIFTSPNGTTWTEQYNAGVYLYALGLT